MTDEEIIKALECCDVTSGDCENCPSKYRRRSDCIHILTRDTIDLINRQQAEINQFADIGKMYSEVRSEAVREFAERLNAKFENYAREDWYGTKYFLVGEGVVNKVASEMFGNPEQVKGEENG